MRLGRYVVGWETFPATWRMVRDAGRVRRRGIPRLPGASPDAIARAVIRANAGSVLRAGSGHFHAMWVADLGKAFTGAKRELPVDYLAAQLRRVIQVSAREGRVPTCFDARGWFDLPWPRADGLPWLLHAVERMADPAFLAEHHAHLRKAYADWRAATLEPRTGLVREAITGDWMDTVPRPSSTYNNLMAMRAVEAAKRLDLARDAFDVDALVAARWTGTHLTDHAGSDAYLSADANVPALYHGLLPSHLRGRIAATLVASSLMHPLPMRTREGAYDRGRLPTLTRLAPSYHSTTWIHLGLMLANGLKREGHAWRHHVETIERSVVEHGNFLETLDPSGQPHRSRWLSTEHGFSMSAGLYLEVMAGEPERTGATATR